LPKNFAIKYFTGIEKAKVAKKGQSGQKGQKAKKPSKRIVGQATANFKMLI
jgi:hypothetical protein